MMDKLETQPEPVQTKSLTAATVTVVMPTYNCRDLISLSLAPLIAMKDRGEIVEIVVVDDGSIDGTATQARDLGARVVLTSGRLGPGEARNIGASQAKGDILWFIDSDVVVRQHAAHTIRRALVEDGYVAVFGSYDDSPPANNFLSQY